jgi:hypothetical protein
MPCTVGCSAKRAARLVVRCTPRRLSADDPSSISRTSANVPDAIRRPRQRNSTRCANRSISSRMWLETRHGLAPVRDLLQLFQQIDPAQRIDSIQGFVQNQQIRVVEQSLSQFDPLTHAFRVAGQRPVSPVGSCRPRPTSLSALPRRPRREAHAGGPSAARTAVRTSLRRRHRHPGNIRCASLADARQASRPHTRTRPKPGRSCPVSSRISVLLPAPFGPTSPVIPGSSRSVTSFKAITGP